MSEEPRSIPPVAYAHYPRVNGPMIYGTSEKLSCLYRGYHGISYAILFGLLTVVFLLGAIFSSSSNNIGPLTIVFGILCLASFCAMFYMTVRSGRDVGFACGWKPWVGPVVGFFAPMVSVLVMAVLQIIATQEMKNYGILVRAFRGVSGKEVRAKIEELSALEGSA